MAHRAGRWLSGMALALVLGAPIPGCKQETHKGSTIKTEALGPVPAPPGLAAELVLAHPNTTWTRVREVIGGPLKLMPASYPMLVVSLLGLPPTIAEQIDSDVPTLGAATSDGSSETPVLAIHVKDGKQVELALTTGPDARYTAKPDIPSGVTLLEPKPGQTALAASLGITGNYLLVAYAPDGLLKIGPYAARTLSTRPAPREDLLLISDHDALAGPLRTRLSIAWGELRRSLEKADQEQREKHGGSAPTFGDPRAALQKADATVQGILALMTDLAEGRIQFTLDDTGAHLKTTLRPHSPNGLAAQEFAAMRTADATALLDLPASTSVGLLLVDSPEIRERGARDQAEAIEKVLADKLKDVDRKRIQDVLASWSKGRGDQLLLGGRIAQGERVLFARSTLTDADTLDRGIRSTFDLTQVPAIAEPMRHWIGDIKLSAISSSPVEGLRGGLVRAEREVPKVRIDPETGRAKRVAVEDKGESKEKGKGKEGKQHKETDGRTEVFEIAWVLDKETATYVIAPEAKAALQELREGSKGTLRGEEEVKGMVSALGSETSFALLVLPMRLFGGMLPKAPTVRPPAAPIVVAFGKGEQGGWFRVDAAPAAVRELAKIRPMD
ncbi:MAG: hypothetical protein RMJ98_03245 [Myxococcales bacterium]|nr:hypothetical protein [Polyangiaceae bacterium]MDW8248306.1 hypothetical protein [Myxococcales bacterium]